jgi:hypothetical protein
VDLSDVGTLATTYGQSNPAFGWVNGDFDNDNDVDLNDLGALASNYDGGRAAVMAEFDAFVPEPANGLLVLTVATVGPNGSRLKRVLSLFRSRS